jgi:retron-type reverse transcriptase
MVNHGLLLERLSADFGFSGASLDWFSSYLRGRTFSVHIGSTFSETASLNSGVPQGSVLGPILFSLYISPISQIIVEHGIDYHAYADDLQLYTAFSVASTLVFCVTKQRKKGYFNVQISAGRNKN